MLSLQILSSFILTLLHMLILGGSYNNEWFVDVWPTEIQTLKDPQSTALYELYPVMLLALNQVSI